MSKVIAIAGMGWLGHTLAQRLQLSGYRVKGSVTSLTKATSFQKSGFNTYPLILTEDGVTGEVVGFLKNVDVLLIMIPPGLKNNTGANYTLKMRHFLIEIEKTTLSKVILVSSTSVYDDEQGKVTEKDQPQPKTDSGRQLLAVEQLYFNAPNFQTSVVRFGGLFGGSRQPVRYLSGRKNLSNGIAPVNLIHRDDCLGILSEIIKRDAFGHIFNAVAPDHPSKEDYYNTVARQLSVEPPSYSEEKEEEFIQVDSENIARILDYSFTHRLLS